MNEQPRDRKSGAIEATRVSIEREVDLRYPHFHGFVTEVSANLSMSGMFVCSESPQPVGTVFSFKFRIEDWKLIQGSARVIWIRSEAEALDRPPGMGVRFVELDAQSRRMVRWLVERHLHEGGQPFELGTGQTEPHAEVERGPLPLEVPADEGSASRPSRSRAPAPRHRQSVAWRDLKRRRRRNRRLVWAATVLLTTVGALVAAWRTGLSPGPGLASSPAKTSAGASPRADAIDAVDRNGVDPQPSLAELQVEIADTVRAWAGAWSEQRVDDYLAFYSPEFTPEESSSREQWEAWRRERVAAPQFIRVAITALDISLTEENLAQAVFFQTYRSDVFTDTIRKTLLLANEEGRWKIVRERSSAG